MMWVQLLGNRLTGPIPTELATISTLWKSHFTSDNFTRELPQFAELTALQDPRISDLDRPESRVPQFNCEDIKTLSDRLLLHRPLVAVKKPIYDGLKGTVTITSTYDSQTRDVESSLVAREDLWRAEASGEFHMRE